MQTEIESMMSRESGVGSAQYDVSRVWSRAKRASNLMMTFETEVVEAVKGE